jgi:ABC-type nitrate/sulfonate/bicarbonate transport system substrate-binding protein
MRERGVRIERDFQLIKTGGPAIIVHLEKRGVDAGIIWEPFVSRLLASGKYRTIMGLGEELDKLTNSTERMAWVGAQEGWLEKNRQVAVRLRAVWLEGADRARTDEAFFRKAAKEFFGLEKPEELTLGWQRMPQSLNPTPWPDRAAIQAEIKRLERARELGILPANAKVDIFWE